MKKLVVILACLGLMFFASASGAYLIDFEDIKDYTADTKGAIPDNYLGFTWSEYAYFITKAAAPTPSGYDYGLLGNYCLYTFQAQPISMSASGTFNIDSAYITAAWSYDQPVLIQGFLGGVEKYAMEILTHNDGSYEFELGFYGIDEILFTPLTGEGYVPAQYAGYPYIMIDNILDQLPANNALPEPTTLILLGAGLLGIGLARRKFK